MIKIQLQTYSDTEVSKYTSYVSNAIPSVGHTFKLNGQYYDVKSVTWFVPVESDGIETINEVHVSAKLKD